MGEKDSIKRKRNAGLIESSLFDLIGKYIVKKIKQTIGLAKKFFQVLYVMEKPEQTFWPTQ